MLRLHADCPTSVERGEESVVAAEIQSKVVEGSTAAQAMKTTHEQAPKVRIVQVSSYMKAYRSPASIAFLKFPSR